MAIDTTSQRTRRAILLGAVGGTVAAVAAAVGRPNPVGATNGDIVHVGHDYSATKRTAINATDYATGIWGSSDRGIGVHGSSNKGTGVYAHSDRGNGVSADSGTNIAIYGVSEANIAVLGFTESVQLPAIFGVGGHFGGGTGVYGTSIGEEPPPPPHATGVYGLGGFTGVYGEASSTGVYGIADSDALSVGVKGESPKGRGVVAAGGKAQNSTHSLELRHASWFRRSR